MTERFAPNEKLQSVQGTFGSPAVEEWYGGYGTREFTFVNRHWQLVFTQALDPAMTKRTFQFRTGGPSQIDDPSDAATTARMINGQREVQDGPYATVRPPVAPWRAHPCRQRGTDYLPDEQRHAVAA